MAEGSALEDLLQRIRGIVGRNREKKLSVVLEKRRRRWRKDCRKRNVPVPKVTFKPVDVVVLAQREQLSSQYESSVDVLAEARKKMLEDVRVLETPRLGGVLDNIMTRMGSINSELQFCESGEDGVSNISTVDEHSLQSISEELSRDISSAQTIQRIKAIHSVAASTAVLSPPAEAKVNSITSTSSSPDAPPTNSISNVTSSPTPMDVGSIVEVRTSVVLPTTPSSTETLLLSPPLTEMTSSPPIKVVVRSCPRVRRSTPRVLSPRGKSETSITSRPVISETCLEKVDSPSKTPMARSNSEHVRLLHEIQRVADTDDGYTKRHTTLKR